jgi:hypothetical protein
VARQNVHQDCGAIWVRDLGAADGTGHVTASAAPSIGAPGLAPASERRPTQMRQYVTVVPERPPSNRFVCGSGLCGAWLFKPLLHMGERSTTVTCYRCGAKHAFYVTSGGKREGHFSAAADGMSTSRGVGPMSKRVVSSHVSGLKPQARRDLPDRWRWISRWRPTSRVGVALWNRFGECWWLATDRLTRRKTIFPVPIPNTEPRVGGWSGTN